MGRDETLLDLQRRIIFIMDDDGMEESRTGALLERCCEITVRADRIKRDDARGVLMPVGGNIISNIT